MTAARVRPAIRSKIGIPLFAKKPSHPSVPLGDQTAGARSEGQGRPSAGACALPLTAARTLAGWCRSGDRTAWHYAFLILAGALSVCAGSGVAVAQSAPVERPAAAHPYAAHIAEADSAGATARVQRTKACTAFNVYPIRQDVCYEENFHDVHGSRRTGLHARRVR